MDNVNDLIKEISEQDKLNLLKEGVKSEVFKEIKEKLLRGNPAEIPGLGSLVVTTRKVKNEKGKNFAVVVKLKQSAEFSNDLVTEYIKNPNKFSQN